MKDKLTERKEQKELEKTLSESSFSGSSESYDMNKESKRAEREQEKAQRDAVKIAERDNRKQAQNSTLHEQRSLSEVVAETPLLSNPTFKSGCTDVLVVQHPDGHMTSTAFNVMFGKYRPARGLGRVVYLTVNKVNVAVKMYMETDGCGYFKGGSAEGRRRICPTPEELRAMNIRPGENELKYTLQLEDGKKELEATIYCVDWESKLVVSDIDGTITRSDMRGHIFSALGRDWSQVGVAKLYGELYSLGYHFVYLTSRSIEAAQGTRRYIKDLTQTVDGVEYKLPPGPVFTSAYRFFKAVNNELIRKVPYEFKIACLEEVASLFPGTNPLYSGFGNRDTDVIAYSKVGICSVRIFIVDKSGNLTCENGISGEKTVVSYSDIAESKLFPDLTKLKPQPQLQQPQQRLYVGASLAPSMAVSAQPGYSVATSPGPVMNSQITSSSECLSSSSPGYI